MGSVKDLMLSPQRHILRVSLRPLHLLVDQSHSHNTNILKMSHISIRRFTAQLILVCHLKRRNTRKHLQRTSDGADKTLIQATDHVVRRPNILWWQHSWYEVHNYQREKIFLIKTLCVFLTLIIRFNQKIIPNCLFIPSTQRSLRYIAFDVMAISAPTLFSWCSVNVQIMAKSIEHFTKFPHVYNTPKEVGAVHVIKPQHANFKGYRHEPQLHAPMFIPKLAKVASQTL